MKQNFSTPSSLFAFRGTPEFTTDGCSGWMTYLWLKVFGHAPPWNWGCVRHDWYYWSGGIEWRTRDPYADTRTDADRFLFDFIHDKGFVFWAWACWLSVRVGGSKYLPFSWRWNYQLNYWRGMLK